VLEHRLIPPAPVSASHACATGTLVFLHEGLGSVVLWRDFPDALAERTGCGALAYSRHGHGASPRADSPRGIRFMHDEALNVLPALLASFAIENPIVIGHSDGGSIGIIYAGASASFDRPPRSIVLLAPHVFVEDCSIASIRRMRTLYETAGLRERLAKYHADVDAAFYGWNDAWLDPAFRNWNIEEYLPAITCPVLVIQGEDDEYGTPRQVDAIAAQVSGPVETMLLPRCGHAPHQDHRDVVIERIASFLSRG
jgi:pimeloyl-ACP methyl ester carboxylesterase